MAYRKSVLAGDYLVAKPVVLRSVSYEDVRTIDLDGESLPNGDGLVLLGRTLYVVQNQLNQIGVVTLSPDLSSGTVGEPLTNPAFAVPTTAAPFGNALYAVNARFGTSPDGTPYEVVRVIR